MRARRTMRSTRKSVGLVSPELFKITMKWISQSAIETSTTKKSKTFQPSEKYSHPSATILQKASVIKTHVHALLRSSRVCFSAGGTPYPSSAMRTVLKRITLRMQASKNL